MNTARASVEFKNVVLECVHGGGRILLDYFGKQPAIRYKGDQSNIVTDADLASERWIGERIRSAFPDHSLVGEETGYQRTDSEFTWVIDPLDGTSNFAAGIPWFGVLVALLKNHVPCLAAMYQPVFGTLYFAESGNGVYRDGARVQVTPETNLKNILCAYGVDAHVRPVELRPQIELLHRVVSRVRNIRSTNCLIDFCFTLDGRLGACLNLNTKIWDIAPLALMLPEAGGRLTDLAGREIQFRLDAEPFDRNYTVLGANPVLHAALLEVVNLA